MQRIKTGDVVQVITGTDKGERGTVEEVINAWYVDRRSRKRLHRDPNNDKVRVEGVNIRKKHRKRTNPQIPGEIVEIRAPIHISNVMLVCPKCDEASRINFKIEGTKKVRVCKRCSETVD